MSVSQTMHGAVSPTPYPRWHDLAGNFTCTRDCFAAYLALEGAEVVEGEKPGNLVNLVDRTRSCGLNPYRLWSEHGASLLAGTGLRAIEMIDRRDSLLLYLYREDLLMRLLERKGVAIILRKQGYDSPTELQPTLRQLCSQVRGGTFPHEIGIFLGYPLKDVLAFMGHIRLAFSCQGPWKIYGDPSASLELACRYRECRCRMVGRLRSTAAPADCLRTRSATEIPGLPYGGTHDERRRYAPAPQYGVRQG